MSKGTRWNKRKLALFLVILLSIESFGAIVSDNDGSAFITKAEFDSLKNDFQTQIDSYNTSIDSKIDGAIAAYLAGVRLSQVSDLMTCLGDYYELPLVNYKSTLQVKNELKECYIALDFAGFWNFSNSNNYVTNPTCIVCSSEGVGHSGFSLATNFSKEDDEYEIKEIYKSMNIKYSERYTDALNGFAGLANTTQYYAHGFVSINFGSNSIFGDASDSWYWAAGGSAMKTNPMGWHITSMKNPDTSSRLTTYEKLEWNSWSVRQDKDIYNKFSAIGTTTKKYPFIISDENVKVPLIANNTFTRNFHLGMSKDKWPKKASSNWQKITFSVMSKNNPERSNYKFTDFSTDMRYYFPTFLEKESGKFDELDTLQKCAKLYTHFNVKDIKTKVYPISGAILVVMENDAEKVDFVFDFKETANKKKYHLLFKKNEAFTVTDITNLESIDYVLNGKKAAKTDYAASGEIKVTINNLKKGDVLWMTWVTDDTTDGGTLNKILSAKMTIA